MPPAEPPPVTIDLPGTAWLPRDFIPDFRAKIDVYRRLSRVTGEGQVDDLAAELADRFGPLPAEVTRMLEFARLRVAAAAHGIDSITRQPGMLVIGHHDPQAIQRLRAAWQAGGKTLRVVGDRSAVVPLEQRVCDDPDRLLAAVRTLLRPTRGRPYSPRPAPTSARP
jgi:transcription-repair coupling factor (superfamily II helicase)